MDYIFHTRSKNHGCFYPQEKGLFFTNGLFPSYLVETMVVFIHQRKCFLPMDYFHHYLLETMVVFIHWISFITSSKGWLFLSTGERAFYQWFYLHTSSNPEVNGRIRPENPESSANSVAAPHLVN
jgi:hypothetical protein